MKVYYKILIIIGLIIYFVVAEGFVINASLYTVGEDDSDCNANGNIHDESEREINNCHKFCEEHPIFYKWGRDVDCYWDD
jgi:hypothetical protein